MSVMFGKRREIEEAKKRNRDISRKVSSEAYDEWIEEGGQKDDTYADYKQAESNRDKKIAISKKIMRKALREGIKRIRNRK